MCFDASHLRTIPSHRSRRSMEPLSCAPDASFCALAVTLVSRSRPALTPPPALNPAPPLPFYHKYPVLAPGGYSITQMYIFQIPRQQFLFTLLHSLFITQRAPHRAEPTPWARNGPISECSSRSHTRSCRRAHRASSEVGRDSRARARAP